MAFSFPSSPTVGDVSVQNGRSYTYAGNQVWELTTAAASGGGSGLTWSSVPASATASGTAGQIAYDNASGFFYVATAASTWKRVALSSWYLDPLFGNTMLLLHMDGTNGSTVVTDSSLTSKTATLYGNASISTSVKQYGTGSLALDGTGDYLTFPSSTDFDLGSYYTIEAWVYPTSSSLSGAVVHRGQYQATGNLWPNLTASIRGLDTVMRFYFYATQFSDEQRIDVAASSFPVDTWTHVAMVRNGTGGAVYVDGTLAGSLSGLSSTSANSLPLHIGTWAFKVGETDTYSGYWSGYIDDVRITKGSSAASGCRYTGDFTKPTAALPGA